MLRILALALSLLFFWAGFEADSENVVGYAAGGFFLILFLGTFLSARHAVIALGGSLSALALMWLGLGKIKILRSSSYMSSEQDSLSFWIQFGVLLGCGMALLIGGILSARKNAPSNSTIEGDARKDSARPSL
jgi:hypothetical protein